MRYPGPPLTVVKLGGSLMTAGTLDAALGGLFSAPISPVIVPGGGFFADAVRQAQGAIGFSDALAHHLAVEAMASFGKVMAERDERLVLFDDPASLEAVRRTGCVPVWDPVPMVDMDPDLPKSWDITSDSLAAWLAAKISAEALVLVKSVDAPYGVTAADLARCGTVDPLFPDFAAAFAGSIYVLGPSDIGKRVREVSELGRLITV